MRRILLSLFLVLEISIAFAGNPIMLIRCRPNNVQAIFGEPCDLPGYITYEGHCFPLPVNGICPSVPGFEYLVPMDVIIDGSTETICVPDCSDFVNCEANCVGPIEWQAALQACGCDVGNFDSFCGCPDPLEENVDIYTIVDGSGMCVVPLRECYDLGIDITIQPFICDSPNAGDDTIRITIKPAPGDRPGDLFVPFDDAITLEDLENCELIDDTGELLDLVGLFGPDDRGAFVADETGCIVIEFTRDPTEMSTISFLNFDPIIIPACPRTFDPCSCRPENIVDANGAVLFWYDELTFLGNGNTTVSVQGSNAPGFLDINQVPISGLLGTTDPTGLLNVPFYRTPGEETNVVLIDGNGNTTVLTSSCNLSPSVCANIVPTLGQWSIITLGLLLMIFSVVAISQKTQKLA